MKNVLVIGAGRMGGAILKGYLKGTNSTYPITIVDPGITEDQSSQYPSCTIVKSINHLGTNQKYSILLLAVKPQMFYELSDDYAKLLSSDCGVISIMAGIETSDIAEQISSNTQVIRCMPNIAAEYGKSVNVSYASENSSAEFIETYTSLFAPSGPIHWLDNESLMHITTALSGSGPAYFFAFVEALTQAGNNAGLSQEFAKDLAIDTIIGAAEMLARNRNPSVLRDQVTSKGGTTAAALEKFSQDEKLSNIVSVAINSAIERSYQLGSKN